MKHGEELWVGVGNGEPETSNPEPENKISILELKLQTRTILCSPSPLIFTSNFLNLPNLLNLPNIFRGRGSAAKFRLFGVFRGLKSLRLKSACIFPRPFW